MFEINEQNTDLLKFFRRFFRLIAPQHSLHPREQFAQALRLYVERYRYDVAQSRDILAVFEEVTGEDLDAFFYEWVGAFDGLDPAVLEDAQARAG